MDIHVYMFFVRNNLIINLKDNLKFMSFDQLRALIKYAKLNNYAKSLDMLLKYYKKRYIYFLHYNDNAKYGINCRYVIKYIFQLADSPVR
jgi:hypothetical protein